MAATAEDPPGVIARKKRRLLGALAWHVRLAMADSEGG